MLFVFYLSPVAAPVRRAACTLGVVMRVYAQTEHGQPKSTSKHPHVEHYPDEETTKSSVTSLIFPAAARGSKEATVEG